MIQGGRARIKARRWRNAAPIMPRIAARYIINESPPGFFLASARASELDLALREVVFDGLELVLDCCLA